jgi:hypothetical protein
MHMMVQYIMAVLQQQWWSHQVPSCYCWLGHSCGRQAGHDAAAASPAVLLLLLLLLQLGAQLPRWTLHRLLLLHALRQLLHCQFHHLQRQQQQLCLPCAADTAESPFPTTTAAAAVAAAPAV